MKLLADECFDGRLAARLRSEGHDVVRIPAQSGLDDLAVATLAEREDRLACDARYRLRGHRPEIRLPPEPAW